MKEIQYAAPTSVAEAVGLLSEQGDRAKLLAGGTDIIVQLREGLRDADIVIDVKKIPELLTIAYSASEGLALGASAPCCLVYGNPEITNAYPALTDSAQIIGGWQIQSRASIGGNLCNASPAADAIPSLLVHQGVCKIAGPKGERELPVSEFCTAPGKNALTKGELLIAIHLPAPAPNSSSAYLRFIPRNEMDIAVAGAASWIQLDASGQQIEQACVALAAVAPTPVLAAEASQWLVGKPASEETFAQAGELAKKAATPIDDMRGTAEYRTHLVGVLVKRTLAKAAERARNS